MTKLLLFVLFIGYVACATTYLQGVIRDQAPNTMKSCGSAGTANATNGFGGTDFQQTVSNSADEKGIAGKECNSQNNYQNCGMIGSDRTPVYAYTGASPGGTVRSPQSFYNWFHDSPQTITVLHTIPLTYTYNGSTITNTYSNNTWYPVDGQGWKDNCSGNDGKKHNYGFCFEVHFRMGYQGGETFEISTTESCAFYVNNMLVIDMLGIHGLQTRKIRFDDIRGLTKSNSTHSYSYRVDLFVCERHTPDSTLKISYTATVQPYCAYYDWCGVCEGNGQSCCTKDTLKQCDDNNICTIESCGVTTPPNTSCVHTAVKCDDNNPCTTDTCNPNVGCVYTPKNSTACCAYYDWCGVCEGNGQSCCNSTRCDDNNACTTDTCDPKKGCVHTAVKCDDNNSCTTDTCDSKKGCVYTPKSSTSCPNP